MKIPLSINTKYRPRWGAHEGRREVMQNAVDATIQHGATMDVRWRKETSTLVIENEGCTLDRDALLLGHTTKEDDDRTAGKFGDGLKIGMLALVRAGHNVKIRTGSEVWIPRMEKTDNFKSEVLVVTITPGRKYENRVQVEIDGVSEEAWKEMPELFLFMSKDKSDRIQTSHGTLLLGSKYAGRVYVKGIFVMRDPKLTYGYDFQDAETDVDRKMIESYDLETQCRYVWQDAMATRPDLIKNFIGLLDDQAKDVSGVETWNASYFPEGVQKAVAADFQFRHGKDAIPVQSLSESAEMGHFGKTGVIVPKPMKALLEAVLGTTDEVKERLREEAQKLYGWHELTAAEQGNIMAAIDLVKVATEVSLDEVDVTDFRDADIRGLFRDGRILLARRILTEKALTRRVLVHEVAHRNGGDGEKAHVAEIERIHTAIQDYLIDAHNRTAG